MAIHVQAMLDMQKRGAVTFDYGNNIRRIEPTRRPCWIHVLCVIDRESGWLANCQQHGLHLQALFTATELKALAERNDEGTR
jgi:hypothetical protein